MLYCVVCSLTKVTLKDSLSTKLRGVWYQNLTLWCLLLFLCYWEYEQTEIRLHDDSLLLTCN